MERHDEYRERNARIRRTEVRGRRSRHTRRLRGRWHVNRTRGGWAACREGLHSTRVESCVNIMPHACGTQAWHAARTICFRDFRGFLTSSSSSPVSRSFLSKASATAASCAIAKFLVKCVLRGVVPWNWSRFGPWLPRTPLYPCFPPSGRFSVPNLSVSGAASGGTTMTAGAQ